MLKMLPPLFEKEDSNLKRLRQFKPLREKEGSPAVWKESRTICLQCLGEFSPSHKNHQFCNMDCARAYNSYRR